MTLAKTCHGSNARLGKTKSYCKNKSCLNRVVSVVQKKIESHFET